MLAINPNNILYLAISKDSSRESSCYNSILYADISPPSTFTMNYAIPCDNASPSFSYTKFIFLFTDGRLLNIGIPVNEILSRSANDMDDYITISIYEMKTQAYNFPKTKMTFSWRRYRVVDAILSEDEKVIFILFYSDNSNYYYSNGTYCCYSDLYFPFTVAIQIDSLASLSILNPTRMSNFKEAIFCSFIGEIKNYELVYYCMTDSGKYASPLSFQGRIPIFYIVKFENSIFNFITATDFFEPKFFSVQSYLTSSSEEILAISSSNFFDSKILNSKGEISQINFINLNYQVKINTINVVEDQYYYGGCYREGYFGAFSSVLYIYSKSNSLFQKVEIEISTNNSCVESSLTNDIKNEIIIASVSTSNNKNYWGRILITSFLQISLSEKFGFDCAREFVIVGLSKQNNLFIGKNIINTTSQNRTFSVTYLDTNYDLIKEITYTNKNDIVVTSGLINSNDEFSLGGIYNCYNYRGFWISHYIRNDFSSYTYFEGIANYSSKVLTSSYISKRIQAFVGYYNSYINDEQMPINRGSLSLIYFITENGKFLRRNYLNVQGIILTKLNNIDENILHAYVIKNNSNVSHSFFNLTIKCPKDYIIDQIENNCFKQCIPFSMVANPNSLMCNPLYEGCKDPGYLETGFACKSNQIKLILKSNVKYDFDAYFINNHQINFSFVRTVKARWNKSSIVINNGKKIFDSNRIKIVNFQKTFDQLTINITDIEQINCANNVYLWYGSMGIMFVSDGYSLPGFQILVKNSSLIPCNNSNSQTSQAINSRID